MMAFLGLDFLVGAPSLKYVLGLSMIVRTVPVDKLRVAQLHNINSREEPPTLPVC